jgi:DNA-binding transcriptional ArsR family regulator
MPPAPPSIAEIAAAVGNPARANVLVALLDGRALTAQELAHAAGVAAPTASGHLARLTGARLLAVSRQGRHAYFRLASPQVGRMLESIMDVAADRPRRGQPIWRGEAALRTARTCYDHLAGRLGVALADALAGRGHVVLTEDGGEVTEAGKDFLAGFGIDMGALARGRRAFCRPCLDWSERRLHLAGALGAALAERCFALGWTARMRDGRALRISTDGARGFAQTFGIDLGAPR